MNRGVTKIFGFEKFIETKCEMIPKTMTLIALIVFLASCSFAQIAGDTTTRFYDDLLNNFVGKWEVTGTAHGQKFTLAREEEWVMNHQYLRIYEKSREVVPWLKVPFERTIYIGYNHRSKRYVVYELTVHGADVPHEPEGLYYADRTGNDLTMVVTKGSEVVGNQRFTWEPEARSWHFQGRRIIDGKNKSLPLSRKRS